MGCSSCGQKRKRSYQGISRVSGGSSVKPNTLNRPIKMKTVKSNKGIEVIRSQPSIVIHELVNTSKKINMLNPSIKGRYIYLVGYKKNCSECQYIKNLLERHGKKKKAKNTQIWALEPKNALLKGVPFMTLPMVYLVEDGTLIEYYSGFEKRMTGRIKDFLFGNDLKEEEKAPEPSIDIKDKKVYILDPDPTLTDSYEKFLKTLDHTNLDRITTFMDPTTNKLVVTVIYVYKK
jgi:hypothetical protein